MTFAESFMVVLWLSLSAAMLAVPAGRRALRQAFRGMARVLGFQPQPARARLSMDPVDRRVADVAAAYVAGKFGYDELDWRILVALKPPAKMARQTMQDRMMERVDVSGVSAGTVFTSPTHSKPWSAAASTDSVPWSAAPRPARIEKLTARMEEGDHCYFRELHSGSGYIGTVCDCGHDMAMHDDAGCNDCDVARLVAPPKPKDAARSVLSPKAYGDLSL